MASSRWREGDSLSHRVIQVCLFATRGELMSRSRIKLMCVLMGVVVVTQLDRPRKRWDLDLCILPAGRIYFIVFD